MASFSFTQVSGDDSGQYNAYFGSVINDSGTVAYEATFRPPGENTAQIPPSAVFASNGDGSTTTLADQSLFSFPGYDSIVLYNPSINNSGQAVISSSGYNRDQPNPSGPTAILSSEGGTVSTVALSSTPFGVTRIDPNGPFELGNLVSSGNFVTGPGINDLGTIAYLKSENDTVSLNLQSGDGNLTTIADTTGPLSNFYLGGLDVGRGQGPFATFTLPSLNDRGEVAFNAGLDVGGTGLFVTKDGSLNKIADTSDGYTYFSLPSLNNQGTIAFNAGKENGESGIFKGSNGKLETIVDSSGLFKTFKSDVAFNDKGQIAFLAELDDGTVGIFNGSDPVTNKVIAIGDPLGNSTVTNLLITRKGLNDGEQIAFDAILADGTTAVFRADPTAYSGGYKALQSNSAAVPEPASVVPVLALGILMMFGLSRRRRMQSAKLAKQDLQQVS